jgi:hypothetical protein
LWRLCQAPVQYRFHPCCAYLSGGTPESGTARLYPKLDLQALKGVVLTQMVMVLMVAKAFDFREWMEVDS